MHGGGADLHFVLAGVLASGGVDDEGHVLVFHQVDDVGALAAGEFGEDVDFDAGVFDDLAGAGGGVEGESEVGVAFGAHLGKLLEAMNGFSQQLARVADLLRVQGLSLAILVAKTLEVSACLSHELATNVTPPFETVIRVGGWGCCVHGSISQSSKGVRS